MSLTVKKLGKNSTGTEQLAMMMLMMHKQELLQSPKLWIRESKVLRLISNGVLNSLNAPSEIAEDVAEYEQKVKEEQRLKAGLSNAFQNNFKMKMWAKAYYLNTPKDGHSTSKKIVATKMRELLIADGFKLPTDGEDAGNDEVPSVDTITRKWLANL